MSFSHLLDQAIIWLLWSALGLGIITIISFIIGWGAKFRLVGATIFSLLLSASCWAFVQSYSPPQTFEGAIYTPIVYDNGDDLVVAQARDDFPEDSIDPTLKQIAENLKGGGRNGSKVNVKIRKLPFISDGISQPVIIGEAIRDIDENKTITFIREQDKEEEKIESTMDQLLDEEINQINDEII